MLRRSTRASLRQRGWIASSGECTRPETRSQDAAGFTFIEVLAALLFLAILVPAIVGGLTISNRAAVLSQRENIAAELAENQLNQQLLDGNWQNSSVNTGDFGQDYPGYRWEMSQETWQGDSTNLMTQLSMRVYFQVQGHEHSVEFATLVSGSNGITTTGSSAATSSAGTTSSSATKK